ncbi:hypothetical protein OIU85_022039 [Salix viminalis]|uniref:Uncharacterized protein n=1 Tax=Salix viminalis TaxID=40686 RepID=A0A9Q0Z7E9_SALVM|nr:hypothetical protein OIU85_022039 [Salix viminalis]
MAEMKDARILEIPVDEEHQQKLICAMNTTIAAFQNHPVKICRFWKVSRQLQRERNDNRALTRCIQELRMEGASFDLSKEPLGGKRMKRSSVELKWKPLTWRRLLLPPSTILVPPCGSINSLLCVALSKHLCD